MRKYLSTLVLGLVACVGHASAEDGQKGDWAGQIGALATYAPTYEGGKKYEFSPSPFGQITWRDTIFFDGGNLGAYAVKTDNFSLGASVGYAGGRKAKDVGLGNGIGKIKGGASASLLAGYEYGPFFVSSSLAHQFTGTKTGFLLNVESGVNVPLSDAFFVSAAATMEAADSRYMKTNFGLTAAEGASIGRAAYDAKGGIKSAGATLTAGYMLSDNWLMMGNVGYKRLLGDAGKSPIVKDRDQYTASIGLAYTFGKSPLGQ